MCFSKTEEEACQKNTIKRVAISFQYKGTNLCGWQRQPQRLSVQELLEEAISQLDPLRPIKVIAAGRTDAGVHAAGQVAHFDTSGKIPGRQWSKALNGRLPQTIRVIESVAKPLTWHACHSAIYRRYRYTIYNGCAPNLFLGPWSWHRYKFKLDDLLMRRALESLVGNHDFAAFQRAGSQRLTSFTTIEEVLLERYGDIVIIEIQASGFLYGMVRLLVGQLVALGEHRLSYCDFQRRWQEKKRCEVKEAAPAQGLCLLRVGYPDHIFSKSACYDSLPKYSLSMSDSPKDPL